jgi:hypothetical protein
MRSCKRFQAFAVGIPRPQVRLAGEVAARVVKCFGISEDDVRLRRGNRVGHDLEVSPVSVALEDVFHGLGGSERKTGS